LPPDQGTGLGKPLKLINHPVRDRIPISVAALGPANVKLVAELAESWQPLFFHPGHYRAAWGEALDAGFAKRDPALGPLDIALQVSFAVGDPDPAHLAKVRDQLALYIGGMGARDKNFYNQLAQRYGYYLDFLNRSGQLDLEVEATALVTPEAVAAFIASSCAATKHHADADKSKHRLRLAPTERRHSGLAVSQARSATRRWNG